MARHHRRRPRESAWPVDARLWDAAAELWESMGYPYLAAMARCREVEAQLSTRAEAERAARLLARVREAADSLGPRPLLDRAEALASELPGLQQ